MLNLCSAAVLEPDAGPEHHRRSSSMRVTGTSYRSSIRERSSDDCIIGTHLGMGMLLITAGARRLGLEKVSTAFKLHPESETGLQL